MKRTLSCLAVLLLSFCLLFVSCERAHDHEWGEWTVIREATCEEEGERRRECACGASGTETIPLAPHTYEQGVCTECGAEKPANDIHDPSLPYEGLEK